MLALFVETSVVQTVEFDGIERAASDVSAEESGDDSGLARPILLAIVALLIIGLGYWFYQKKRRRYGYEEIPVQLIV